MSKSAQWMGREIAEGWYKCRRVPKGPFVGVEVTFQDGMIYVVEDGAPVAHGVPADTIGDIAAETVIEGGAFTHPVLKLMLWGVRITEAEYRHLIAVSAWASVNSPDSPHANPTRAIDVNSVPIRELY
jgi:hypothetical protein